jgi:enediyne polyketide synthase
MSRYANIALVSTACRFPDANSPGELWANVLEGRRSFRAVPKERLDIARYAVNAVGEADSITHIRAGLLTNWQVDRSGFRIPQKTYEATDLTHWLALEVAAEAIAALGGPDRLDRARTAVVVANTLTGEFSRTALLRLRLPFLEDAIPPLVLFQTHRFLSSENTACPAASSSPMWRQSMHTKAIAPSRLDAAA